MFEKMSNNEYGGLQTSIINVHAFMSTVGHIRDINNRITYYFEIMEKFYQLVIGVSYK